MSSIVQNETVILITGAGKGIGAALVKQLIKRRSEIPGLKLFLTARTQADLESLKASAIASGISCETLSSDLALNPTAAFDACMAHYGRLDVLLHSAGVGRFADFLDLTSDDVNFVLKTNVEASFLLLQKTYAQMKSQTPLQNRKLRGQIQWVTSVAAEKPFPQSALYCMSKFAQRGLIEVMRGYGYQDGIRILDIKPGATFTPMWGEVSTEMREKMMSAESVANSMIYALLLADDASIEEITIRPVGGDL